MIRASRSAAALAALAPALLVFAGSCIRTDVLEVNDGSLVNRNAVRIVEPIILTAEAQEGCDDPTSEETIELCPQPPGDPHSVLPHFLDPNFKDSSSKTPLYDFCSCPDNQVDLGSLTSVTFYMEDRDAVGEANGDKTLDDLYAALLLDPDPTDDRPQLAAAYSAYYNPQEALELASVQSNNDVYRPIGRDTIQLRELKLGDENGTRFDLCNGAGKDPLSVGYHRLDIVVTDRPWVTLDNEVVQVGVPDLAQGATFDVATYVFRCDDSMTDLSGNDHCNNQCKPLNDGDVD
ncbi:MAG: hypothetical protein R3B09_28950 [Nannocystaceae bacterium]